MCCAQAIMLCPRVLFLDEPTTGVDPVSRRSLNRMIKRMKQASVLLTTHRMDEAEQLCDKISIMINGRFVVFGSPNYLKTQYGSGYTVQIKQTVDNFNNEETNIIKQIETLFPDSLLVHSDGQQAMVQIGENPDQPPSEESNKVYETRFKIMGINAGQENEEGKPKLTLSYTFSKLAELLEQGTIKDFTLTRTTMGEIFTDFAKFQIDNAA